tara:strand:- start:4501 stop:4833 length:333 start_codon:yes stop_codon:yes gene_type:complete
MNISKLKLKQIIKEELANMRLEGWNPFKKEQEDKPSRLKRITMEDIFTRWGRDSASLYQTGENAELRKKVEKDVDALVQKMMADPRGGGPRDNFERTVRRLADQYRDEIK